MEDTKNLVEEYGIKTPSTPRDKALLMIGQLTASYLGEGWYAHFYESFPGRGYQGLLTQGMVGIHGANGELFCLGAVKGRSAYTDPSRVGVTTIYPWPSDELGLRCMLAYPPNSRGLLSVSHIFRLAPRPDAPLAAGSRRIAAHIRREMLLPYQENLENWWAMALGAMDAFEQLDAAIMRLAGQVLLPAGPEGYPLAEIDEASCRHERQFPFGDTSGNYRQTLAKYQRRCPKGSMRGVVTIKHGEDKELRCALDISNLTYEQATQLLALTRTFAKDFPPDDNPKA